MQERNLETQVLESNLKQNEKADLPPIPDKIYFTIGEVALLCGVKPHVLRYWEQEFSRLKPAKRRGNRRFYQYKDVLLIRQIRILLYEKGFTIDGARAELNRNPEELSRRVRADAVVTKMIAEMENVLQKLVL
ncbi:MerR family transcriptional regulator [Gammaproteobacteria bacterium SCGC AG-212-F23]|nr:MerR family transcriptional regulator [Gammaproteobacteria bacterium SCGC AG-212-F23]